MTAASIPRALLALTPDQQARVAAWLGRGGEGFACRQTEARFQIKSSEQEMRTFSGWFHIARHFLSAAALAKTAQETLAVQPEFDFDDETLAGAGQVIFEKLAVENLDSDLFAVLRKLRQKDHALALEDRKVVLLEKQAALAGAKGGATPEKQLTPEEKERKIQGFFSLGRREEPEGAGGGGS